jgi:YfiH family protein
MSMVRRMSLDAAPGALASDIPVTPDAQAGISLIAAGDMRLSRDPASPSRSRFLAARGIDRGHLYAVRQVHSRQVLIIDGQSAAETAGRDADGLLSARADVVLSVTVADCLPIFLVDRGSGAFGIVHSGWRGTGIVADALLLLAERFGSKPREVTAVIGPGIGSCCYTVPRDRAAQFVSRYGTASVVEDGGPPRLDLRAANLVLLEESGVQDIGVFSDCTSCTPSLGSFRRQGPAEFSLMLAWIGRRPPVSR